MLVDLLHASDSLLSYNKMVIITAAFDHLRIRLGGSLQDRVVYDVGTESPCSPFTNVSNALFGFSVGCLGMDRWDKLNDLFERTG